MAGPRKATRARKATKATKAAKRPAKRTTPPKEPQTVAEALAQQQEEARAANPDFRMEDDGSITWRMGDVVHVLQPLTVEAYIDLDWRRRGGGALIVADLQEAAAMEAATSEERVAKAEQLEKANRANYDWLVEWYAALFTWCERDGKPFDPALAPAWVFRANTMMSMLDQLEGKAPPGVGVLPM